MTDIKSWDFKHIKLEDMMEYIEKKAPATVEVNGEEVNTKSWFKSVAIDANGKYQHLIAVRAFCEKFCPEIIPVGKPKEENKSKKLLEW
jgi:hypothetical protein